MSFVCFVVDRLMIPNLASLRPFDKLRTCFAGELSESENLRPAPIDRALKDARAAFNVES